ncbi:MAG: hypothetical protein C3F02_04785 [Parcubacteria group bacterium]|nr:MAG: hypothetical protein C3F02_04785 [Parcubacteria group bacterium]
MSKLHIKNKIVKSTPPGAKKSSGVATLHKIIDNLRPALERDGGSLELVSYDAKSGLVEISFTGACAHCPISDVTLKYLIEAEIKAQLSGVKEVRAV